MFGFFKKKSPKAKESQEPQEIDPVRFLGALNGVDANLGANVRLADAGLVRAKELVTDALSRRAELLRLEPKGEVVAVTQQIDGISYSAGRLSKAEGLAVTQILKLLAGLDIKQRKVEQKGGIKAEFQQKAFELLIASLPVPEGERLTLRANDLTVKLEMPNDIGMSEEQRKKIRELSAQKGLFIVCGPPASGTTTTLWAVARGLDSFIYSIFTLGDTGGRKLHNIPPFEATPGDELGTTIARAIRKEADVLVLDPLRNAAEAKILFGKTSEISLLTEMSARDIPTAILQLVSWVGDAEVVAQGLRCVLTQKLIRVLCKDCKQAYRPNSDFLAKLGMEESVTALYRPPQPPAEPELQADYVPCEECGAMGYLRRTGMFELLVVSEGVQKVIREKGTDPALFPAALKQVVRDEKQVTLQQDGMRLVATGKTSLEELQRAFKPPAGATTSGAHRTGANQAAGSQTGAIKATGARPAIPKGSAPPAKGPGTSQGNPPVKRPPKPQ